MTSGEYSVLLKVRVPDSSALEHFVNDQIRSIRGVLRVRVEIALSTRKETPAVAPLLA